MPDKPPYPSESGRVQTPEDRLDICNCMAGGLPVEKHSPRCPVTAERVRAMCARCGKPPETLNPCWFCGRKAMTAPARGTSQKDPYSTGDSDESGK